MQRAVHGALGGRPAALGEFRAQERRGPARRRIAMRLRVTLAEQRVQRRLPLRSQPARCPRMHALGHAGGPTLPPGRRPVVHARLGAAQRAGDVFDDHALRAQQHCLVAPPVADFWTPGLCRLQRGALVLAHGEWHRLPSCSCREVYYLYPLRSTHVAYGTTCAFQPRRCGWERH